MILNSENTIQLEAEKWVQGGYVLAHAEGSPVFLHGALPGETVRARIVKTRASHAFALTEETVTAADNRLVSDCPVFPRCGGCSFRHVSYEDELAIKADLLREHRALQEALEGAAVRTFTSEPLAYRNHVQLQVEENGRPGFFALHTNTIVPLPPAGCAHLGSELNQALLSWDYSQPGRYRFRDTAFGILSPADLKRIVFAREQLFYPEEDPDGRRPESWLYPADGFFQSNKLLLPQWLGYMRSVLPENKPRAVELFCGSALLGGFARDLLGSYVGFESDKSALKAARRNFKEWDLAGDFHVMDLYRQAPDLSGAELIIANPPRAGLKKRLLYKIVEGRNSKSRAALLYSSCNPATLNRDLAFLMKGGFKVQSVAVFDFFPRTPHLEIALLLV